jgi:hypothetical protein
MRTRRRRKNTEFITEGNKRIHCCGRPQKCPFVLQVKVGVGHGRALGSDVGTLMGVCRRGKKSNILVEFLSFEVSIKIKFSSVGKAAFRRQISGYCGQDCTRSTLYNAEFEHQLSIYPRKQRNYRKH